MIYVRMELWPHGNREKAVCLGEATIWNKGGTLTRGEYGALFSKKGGFRSKRPDEDRRVHTLTGRSVWRRGEVHNFPRKQLLAWDLLYRALRNLIGDRNQD